jgi:CubicO group peptidase (beta-lactamase class C family)
MVRSGIFCLISLAVALQAADPAGAGMDAARLARIPARMKEFVDEGKAAGIVTLVARHGRIAGLEAVGWQEIETKKPMRVDSIFRIASLTKPVTCAGIMVLVDEGRISLLDPVENYLPEFKGQKANVCAGVKYNCATSTPARPINVMDLMTHTSGLPGGFPESAVKPATLAEEVAGAGKLTLLFEPGTAWNYSNVGYATLGRIIEVVSKMPYDRFIAARIFEPLGMKDSSFFVDDAKRDRIAAVYTDQKGVLKRAASVEAESGPRIPAPQGGILSTAMDMFRFNQMMLNKGTLDGHRVLSAAAVEAMTMSMTGDLKSGFAPGVGHGFGYEVVREPVGTYRYNSLGSFVKGGAYRTYEFVDPAKDLVGVFMMQRTNGGGDVADEINVFAAMAAAAIEK